jgi:hypothetical protein
MLILIVLIPVLAAIIAVTLVTVYRDGYGRIRS